MTVMMKDTLRLVLIFLSRQRKQSRLAVVSMLISISTMTAILSLVDAFRLSFAERSILAAVTLLMLIVSLSTIVISVNHIMLYRAPQFGIMKAVGASNKWLFSFIILEALIIGMLGGLGGIVGSNVLVLLFLYTAAPQSFPVPETHAIALLSSLLVGISTSIIAGWLSTKRVRSDSPATVIKR